MVDSARKIAMDALRRICEEQSNRRYYVKRGAINWTRFPFDTHEYALAIMMDTQTFMKQSGMNEATVTLEVFAAMPKHSDELGRTEPGIDDGLLDTLIEDVVAILSKWRREKHSGDSVLFTMKGDSATIAEAHDVGVLVQGVVASIDITF